MCIENHREFTAADLLTLKTSDGSVFGAFHARPEAPTGGRIVLLPDIGGLRPDYIDLARLFTQTGCDVLAIDYYGRTAGPGPHAADFDHEPHVAAARRENVLADIAAGVAYLDSSAGSGPTFTLGYCVGGAHSLYAGTVGREVLGVDLAGVIAFCPYLGAYGQAEALPEDFVAGLKVPMLGLFGAEDTAVPVAVAEGFEARLSAAGLPHEIVIYPGQPHGFFEWHHLDQPGHEEAAADAWQRVTAFTRP